MAAESSSTPSRPAVNLELLDPATSHKFSLPAKKIHDGPDVSSFLVSKAYRDIMTFILQLNRSMFPTYSNNEGKQTTQTWELGSEAVQFSLQVQKLMSLITKLEAVIDEVPPDTGPRRFGNMSFRRWYQLVEDRVPSLLEECLHAAVLHFGNSTVEEADSISELRAYFLGSFGSAQRLDYGTGHELSFLAFLGCVWKLGGFAKTDPGVEERGIVLGVIEPYLHLIRRLIKTYTLEPAGSHGVWGLDDNSFLPYIFGSAQFSPAISESDQPPTEGSLPDAPDPSGVAKANIVERERKRNMYFSAIGFIYDVKKGPFWEHSPMLYDISGVRTGWAKLNKGMIKMYSGEVLSKFPVVQHFPFGSLFSWERDPNAVEPTSTTVHTASQPSRPSGGAGGLQETTSQPPREQGTRAPWATSTMPPPARTTAPWGSSQPIAPLRSVEATTEAPWATQKSGRHPPPSSGPMPATRAPWASSDTSMKDPRVPTKAPWAKLSNEGSRDR